MSKDELILLKEVLENSSVLSYNYDQKYNEAINLINSKIEILELPIHIQKQISLCHKCKRIVKKNQIFTRIGVYHQECYKKF